MQTPKKCLREASGTPLGQLLAHGAYWSGELDSVVDAFGLKRTTPHNFLVLRPDPIVWTPAGGLLLVDVTRPEHHTTTGC